MSEGLKDVLEQAQAAIWDAYYGRCLTVEYARVVSAKIDTELKRARQLERQRDDFRGRLAETLGKLMVAERQRDEAVALLRKLSQATLAAAQCLNRSSKGEGCDLADWYRARQDMDVSRKAARQFLATLDRTEKP
jgi:hypothetical protein